MPWFYHVAVSACENAHPCQQALGLVATVQEAAFVPYVITYAVAIRKPTLLTGMAQSGTVVEHHQLAALSPLWQRFQISLRSLLSIR